MSIRTPPTLLWLTGESLLRDQASAIAALEYLPAELFPPLFIQACRRRMRKLLKVLVQAWPFPVLPLGSLMRLPPVMILKAVLEGLDGLLAQEDRPRRWKLRVLDLRNMDVNLWRMWCGHSTWKCSQTGPVAVHCSSPNMEHPLAPLEVFLDLDFSEMARVKFFMYIIQWAQQRKGSVHLCCKTLNFLELPFQRTRKVLDRVRLDCIQEVEVDCTWDLPTLGTLALYLGQMSNLQSLALCHIKVLAEGENEEEEMEEEEEVQEEEEQEEQKEKKQALEEEYLWEREEKEQQWKDEEEWEREEQEWEEEEEREREEQEEQGYFSQFLSQMQKLKHLKKLYLDSPSFLQDRLDQMLRCLQTPLDKLSIWDCWQLTQSDLTRLFQCPNLRQLKSLCLYGANLTDFSPEPLRALLEAVAPTLQDLHLDNCAMVDSQVEAILQAILPVLSCCHQLRDFTITENPLSVATIKKLLRYTAGLRSLERELYPVPLECYRTHETVDQETVALIQAELTETLRELGQPRTIGLDTKYFSSGDFCDVAFS
ncbi:PRAME family member 9/15 [Myotis brandtii]|uniref:PRAME family member 9/15 n=1 Tax=Myotis brandtii TaxID=109478 RepID=S7MPR6_MYOBR|nr:PRAME family member 9/15 [Myotis brandtii]